MTAHSSVPVAGAQATASFSEPQDPDHLIAAVAVSSERAPAAAAAVLALVRHGVVTGEGPTTRGRVHFSRTLDAEDAALCHRTLLAVPDSEGAVTAGELNALLAIDAAATERTDGGRFAALLVRALAQHVMASSGRPVPSRASALAAETPLGLWVSQEATDAILRSPLVQDLPPDQQARVVRLLRADHDGHGALPGAPSLRTLLDRAA